MDGIYVHIPFCKSKCTYCDFASYPKEINKQEAYFACLYREIKGVSLELKERVFDTIYIGGGTPSIVSPELIMGLIRQIKKCFKLTKNPEITIEINPGTVDEEKIKVYKNIGINRFSIGLQSGYDSDLVKLGRVHTAKDFLILANLLKGENISADILLGLEGQTIDKVKKTIDLCVAANVKHISMYALTPEVGTPIYTNYLNGELLSDDEVALIYDEARAYLKEKGFNRYEISNFSKPNFESRHNKNYWKRGEYIGFGVSASSFIDNKRFTNTYSIDEYMNAIINNKKAYVAIDEIEEADAKFEFIMLGLRQDCGININEYNTKFNSNFLEEYKDVLNKKSQYLDLTNSTLRIKEEYIYVQNSILLDFMK